MSDSGPSRADDLFEKALELPPEEREPWLSRAAGDDRELLREVRELLEAHEMSGGILDGTPPLPPPPPVAREGRRIGPYRVVRELGRGGMGVVYLAERDDGQFRRTVAIKLLRDSTDADELARRLRAERQILASLEHPNIAQLLDGGVTDGQLPYLVMEYVEGLPLTDYCDARGLGIDERLTLFQEVCSAVRHAHRNLVIHRDLKPSNILVTEDGQVKLLDFGIAKLLGPGIGAVEQPPTRTGLRAMTPEYASPEQVRGEPLSTASDVYALGVVLYELLAGRRPYELATGSPAEMAEVVCRAEPPKPSTMLTEAQEGRPSPAEVSAARGVSVDALRRRLRGDLDAIVMMALRKEPDRRYGSADLLAADVQRYLDGLPVLAHRGSRRYRAWKFLRRHRVEAAAAAIVILALTVGAGAAAWQASVARAERDRAEMARAEAEEALAESEEVTAFLMGLFQATDPEEALGDTVTARELLRRGVERAGQLEGRPHVQARMLEVVGRVHRSLGEFDRARPLLTRALEIREGDAEADGRELVSSLASLAELYLETGELAEAESLFRRALATLEDVASPEDDALVRTLVGLARTRQELADYDEAESLFRRALELQRASLGEDHPAAARTGSQLATVLHNQGRYDEAEEMLRATLAARRRAFGENHPEVALNLIQLAGIYAARDERYDRSEALHRQALEIRRRVYGDHHPAVAKSLHYVSGMLGWQGKDDEAEPLLRRALEMQRKLLGPRHHEVGGTMNSLALLLLRTGRVDEAERLFRETMAIWEETLGPDHHYLASILGNLGRVALARGDLDGAETLFRESLARRERTLGREHPYTTATLLSVADVLRRKGAYAESEALYREALEAYRRRPSAGDEIRGVHRALADLYADWGRPEDALRHRTAEPAPPGG